jgi:uncharacterized cupin superfamily protein
MADVTIKRIDELESARGQFFHAARGLGVTSFGMSVQKLPAGWDGYPEHDHAEEGQEEVYFVLEGSVTLQAEHESFELVPGMLARVAPTQARKLIPGGEGVTLMALGGTPGKAFDARA